MAKAQIGAHVKDQFKPLSEADIQAYTEHTWLRGAQPGMLNTTTFGLSGINALLDHHNTYPSNNPRLHLRLLQCSPNMGVSCSRRSRFLMSP